MSKPAIYMLIDGNALIHRGFHAIPNLSTKTGIPTNAIYGFTHILLNAIKSIKPTHIACSFDLAGPTFRHEQYKEYKATRTKAPQELYDQIPLIKDLVKTLNIPIYEAKGFEADDVLGSLAAEITKHLDCEKEKGKVVIVTGDMDVLQLVDDCVNVFTMKKGISDTVMYTPKEVKERYGFSPKQVIDYKALRGDASDNIKGVKGIGEVTATKLLQDFGTLDGIYEAIDSGRTAGIKPKTVDLLEANKEEAYRSYWLATIVTTVPLHSLPSEYTFGVLNYERTVELFKEYEFRSLLDKLPKEYAGSKEEIKAEVNNVSSNIGEQNYKLITSVEELKDLEAHLSTSRELCIDTETTGFSPQSDKLVGLAVSDKEGSAWYIPADLLEKNSGFAPLQNSKITKIGHNLKFDIRFLEASGYPVTGNIFDTLIAAYDLSSNTRSFKLDTLVFSQFGYQMQPIEDLIGKGKDQITMDKVDPEKVSWYSCEDVDMTLRLKQIYEPEIKKENLEHVYYDIDLPLGRVLGKMEDNGIKVDAKVLEDFAAEAEKTISNLEKKIHTLAGREFNIASPKQLKEILFDELKLDAGNAKKTKTGISTAADELEKLRGQHEIIDEVLKFREISKLQSTYLTALPELINKKTGRIHTSYNQTIASTGRLSSVDPNLQNIPVKSNDFGIDVRSAFVADKGKILLSADYSQIELRVVAHLSGDKSMQKVFTTNGDIHSETAQAIFGIKPELITKDMRRVAKVVNFSILYGVSSFGLSSRVGEIDAGSAKKFIDAYYRNFEGVKEYLDKIKLEVREKGKLYSEVGRLRHFPEIYSSQFFLRGAAERAAINFPIQSLAADIIKLAMINLHEKLKGKGDIKMLLQVHDELVFEVDEDKQDFYGKLVQEEMQNAYKLNVPLKVDLKSGKNWSVTESYTI